MGLELFKDSDISSKLHVFFDMCDIENTGVVTETELYNVLKHNIVTPNDRLKLKQVVREIFREGDINGDGFLSKDELYNVAHTNTILRSLLEER